MAIASLQLHIHDRLPEWFDAVNRHVSVVDLLEHLGLAEDMEEREDGTVLVGRCPLHCGNDKGEFYVYTRWNCWSCYGQCRRGGTPLDLVKLKEGVEYPMAALLLQSWYALDLKRLGLVQTHEH